MRAVLACILLAAANAALSRVRIDPLTRRFVDSSDRTLAFHGMNAVYKKFPWYPRNDAFDPSDSLSSIDASNLASWGFNVVRLGVMWPGVEPSRGNYNATYLSKIEEIVDGLGEQGIYVVLDLHQDLFHRQYCGEGVPDYVYETCKSPGVAAFPAPVAPAGSYPLDASGAPALDACLSKGFASYYFTSEVSAGFQCLYDNESNLWDSLAGFWGAVAERFKGKDNVLAYELLNEPWFGDVRNQKVDWVPGHTEKKYLQPMYQHVAAKIREIDDETIILWEGLTFDYFPSGFDEAPNGPEYNDRQAISYHIYCVADPTKIETKLCAAADEFFFQMRQKDGERLGVPLIMTEFGAAEDKEGALAELENTVALAERHQQSWMYWQFKYYEDITTCTPTGEGLYDEEGQVVYDKLAVLARTYPTAVASRSVAKYAFEPRDSTFAIQYALRDDVADLSDSQCGDKCVTELRFSTDPNLFYRRGVHVTADGDGAASVSVVCGDKVGGEGVVRIVQKAGESVAAGMAVEVQLRPCGEFDVVSCSCPF